ncbi:MAG: DUF3017 domain-containing protein [Ornithinimicrobium sp.]
MANEHRRWRVSQPLGLWWLLPAGLTLSLAILLVVGLRPFGYAMATTVGVAAAVRLLLPGDRAGGLIVRSRTWDVVLLLVFAVATAALAASLVIR